MIIIPGYQILSLIYESSNSLIYRVKQESNNQPKIFKILNQEHPSREELTRYKQEYEITSSFYLDNIIKAYQLEKYQNTIIIILEDFGGNSLNSLSFFKQPMTIETFFPLAIKITEALGIVHAANIIHKDINPSNLVFNHQTGELKIIDFGISTVFPRENPSIKNPNVLEGTG